MAVDVQGVYDLLHGPLFCAVPFKLVQGSTCEPDPLPIDAAQRLSGVDNPSPAVLQQLQTQLVIVQVRGSCRQAARLVMQGSCREGAWLLQATPCRATQFQSRRVCATGARSAAILFVLLRGPELLAAIAPLAPF